MQTFLPWVRRARTPLFLSTIALLLLLASPRRCYAQSFPTEYRGATVNVFAGYTYVMPDYGPDNINDTGITYGGDFDKYLGTNLIVPGIEVRGTYVTGQVVNENTFSGGFRVHTTVLRRIHPYGNFLAGFGNIDYNFLPFPQDPSYTKDNGIVYTMGGGFDIDVYRNFALKIDGQHEAWNLGTSYTLSPSAIFVGVTYRIPFKPWLDARHDR